MSILERLGCWTRTCTALAVAALGTAAQAAPVIAYEWTEGAPGQGVNSPHTSQHGVQGPVLADDFIPAFTGRVVRVDWWGSAPLAVGAPDQWEATFHTDAPGAPAAAAPSGGIAQHFLASGGLDPDGDGVFFYSAAWVPQDVFVVAGTTYWFSVANAQPCPVPNPNGGCAAGWTWAYAGGGGPTVGAEVFAPMNSVGIGPNGGPHFGPWNLNLLANGQPDFTDLAFRVWVDVPEPSTTLLLGLALLGLMASRPRRP